MEAPIPRDSQGQYTLPSGYRAVTGQKVLASQHNPPLEDMAAAMTGSLPRSGSAPMTGDLPMGGFRVTNVAPGTASSDAVTKAQIDALFFPGIVIDYAGATEPSGWLFCDGREVSRSAYSALFSAIGTQFGAGNGSTTFNLPDLRGRVSAGRDNMSIPPADRLAAVIASYTLGAAGGFQTVALSAANNGPHTHGVTDPGHAHTVPVGNNPRGGNWSGGGGNAFADTAHQTTTAASSANISIQSSGSGVAHLNVQPTLILNKIIKV